MLLLAALLSAPTAHAAAAGDQLDGCCCWVPLPAGYVAHESAELTLMAVNGDRAILTAAPLALLQARSVTSLMPPLEPTEKGKGVRH